MVPCDNSVCEDDRVHILNLNDCIILWYISYQSQLTIAVCSSSSKQEIALVPKHLEMMVMNNHNNCMRFG